MSLLFIDDKKVLGLGHERACFIHPTDETKCIKVSQKGVVHRNQNQIESYYFGILKRNLSLLHTLPNTMVKYTRIGETVLFLSAS